MGLRHILNKIKINLFLDKHSQPIDNGIKPLVLALWNNNYKTDITCEGHIDFRWNHPLVVLPVKDNDLKTLAKQIVRYNTSVTKTDVNWRMKKCYFEYNLNKDGFYYELAPKRIYPLEKAQNSVKTLADFLMNC